ncbi:ribosome maturation factor RimM [Elioraea thermophila]|uniref:ribosome maturation factor RimM n=1 Tax=Elioraea thermophila TaxID=2185104 RepID=UPI000DF41AA2|nr:ribosome maturation factor RimM [Elioraea thermophila]
MAQERILLGVIGRPHGVKGLVRVQSFTADPCAIADYGPLADEAGRRFALRVVMRGAMPVCAIDGVADRDAAARLTGTRLYAERAQLPALEDPDEFYRADLIGLAAEDAEGRVLGRVTAVEDYGAGTFLEIAADDGLLTVPFTRTSVPLVDLARGRLVVIPPAEVVVPPSAAGEREAAA